MYIETWEHGCKVTVSDWIGNDINGETPIRIGVEYIKPGETVSRPTWERVLYCPRSEEQTIKDRLNSIVLAIITGDVNSREIRS